MDEDNKDILLHYEIEALIENLEPTKLEDFGTKKWFECHKKLMLLSQQSILEVSNSRTEIVKEWFVTFQKIIILIHEAIQISVWKNKVYHHLINNNNEPTNTFMIYSILYHENISVSLLENILYHCDGVESLDDSALDLVDYAVDYITRLVFQKNNKISETIKNLENISCIEELTIKKNEIEFDIGIKCISIIGYFARFSDNISLSILKRMLTTHDIPYLFTQLIETKPWKKINENNEIIIYNSSWEKIEKNEANKICRAEGQVWLGLRELLLNPKCGPYYEITDFRMTELIKLPKYLHEEVLDQIAPLMDLRRWLSYLNISSQTDYTKQSPLIVEIIPQIKSSIIEKYHKKWKKLAKIQEESLFSKNIDYIKSMAEILSGAYDIDKLFIKDVKQCALCRGNATKKCSKCKNIFYCGRECQVKDWASHKNTCI